MSTLSEPVLAWLRKLIRSRGTNTIELAEQTGLPRNKVRRLLTGADTMTLEELLKLSHALDISPEDMRLSKEAVDVSEDESETIAFPEPQVDPYGNHAEQLVRIAFDLGSDFLITLSTKSIADSGVPQAVLAKFEDGELPIRLDAKYHRYNDPRYTEDALTLTLSFDQLHDCTFPWSSIRQILFLTDEPKPEIEPSVEPRVAAPHEGGKPHLRLIT